MSCATVLTGVDGVLDGRRERARLFAPAGNVPMVVSSVGDASALHRAMGPLSTMLTRPIVCVERVALVKQGGELLSLPPGIHSEIPSPTDVWETISVYTRRNAQVSGRPLYTELTRRLRELGGAGATTVLGDWGFSGTELPHGDRLGRVASHRPAYTVYIDRPQKVAELWPTIDEVTAEHGVVTSLLVPGYLERAG